MEHILVPIDFSPDSEKTIAVAASEARLRDAKVTLLHVIEAVSAQDTEFYPAILTETNSERQSEAYSRLKEIGLRVFGDITHEVLVRHSIGSAYSEIILVQSELPVSLIVMSFHSRTFFEKLLLESTSNKVINSSRCPVLVVPV